LLLPSAVPVPRRGAVAAAGGGDHMARAGREAARVRPRPTTRAADVTGTGATTSPGQRARSGVPTWENFRFEGLIGWLIGGSAA
jgi:hypothetical protein